MKNFTKTTSIIILVSAVALSGCARQSPSNSTSFSIYDSQTSTISQDNISKDISSEMTNDPSDNFSNEIKCVIGEKTYYLDTSEIRESGDEVGFMLYCKDNASGKDTQFNILADSIKEFGEQLFVLTSTSDKQDNPYDGVDTIYRIDKEGNKTFICRGNYYNSIGIAIKKFGNTLYFTSDKEDAIFKTNLNSEKIERMPVVIPDANELYKEVKLTAKCDLFSEYAIYEEKDGFIHFFYYISSDKTQYLRSIYKMSINDNHIEKEYSTFLDNRQKVGDWIYYLDLENPIETEEAKIYNIHKMKSDRSEDTTLDIQCFRFDISGEYLYADADLSYGDFAHWKSYQYKIDGTGKKALDYSDMMRYVEGNKLYFIENWSVTIYIADTACNVLDNIKVIVPDESALREKLGDRYYLVTITVTDQDGDWLNFDYDIGDPGGKYYSGKYRVNMENK